MPYGHWERWRLSTLCYICGFTCHERVLKTFSGLYYFRSEDDVCWLCHFLVNLHIYGSPYYPATAQSQCLMVIWRDSGLSSSCNSYRLVCQQRVTKMFSGAGYLCFEDDSIWIWHFLVNLHISDLQFYAASDKPQRLMVIGRDSGLSTLCHSCGFACQQWVLKMLPVPGYLGSKMGWFYCW